MQLNIQPQTITFGSVTDLLNGAFASLSGPVGFTPTQPRITITGIRAVNPSTSAPVMFSLFKGASGASANGTQIFTGLCDRFSSMDAVVDVVLDSSDFLTGVCVGGGSLVVNISAEISF